MIPDCITLDPDTAAMFMLFGGLFMIAAVAGFAWTLGNLTDPNRKDKMDS